MSTRLSTSTLAAVGTPRARSTSLVRALSRHSERVNGSLAVGVATRCCRLMGPTRLDDDLAAAVADLDAGTPATYPRVRAAMSAFAVRAAAALVAFEGSRGIERGTHAERLYREAAVLEIFATRPAIRAALLATWGAFPETG